MASPCKERTITLRRHTPLLAAALALFAFAVWAMFYFEFFISDAGKLAKKAMLAYLAAAAAPAALSFVHIRIPERWTVLARSIYMAVCITASAVLFGWLAWETPFPAIGYFFPVTCLIFACLYFAVWALVWNVRIAAPLGFGLVLFMGYAYERVFSFRGIIVSPSDLLALETAANVAASYQYPLSLPVVLSVLMLGVLIIAGSWLPQKSKKRSARAGKGLCLLACAGWMYTLLFTAFLPSIGAVTSTYDPALHVLQKDQGPMVTFMLEWRNLLSSRPEHYNAKNLEKLETELQALGSTADTGLHPNIVVIVNEAFSDPTGELGVETDADPLPFLHAWQQESLHGRVYMSSYGGTTCNTEYSFLTSVIPVPNVTMPLFQSIREETPSLPWLLKELGYSTTAIHPAWHKNYHRHVIYPRLGFDRFVSWTDFKDPQNFHGNVSDQTSYDMLIDCFENKADDQPAFFYLLTVQNHSPYNMGTLDSPIRLTRSLGSAEADAEMEEYLALVQESDRALEALMAYFGTVEEPTLVVFFGDHQPYLSFPDAVTPNSTDLQADMINHHTPLVLWANYPMETGELPDFSVNYLAALILEQAGLPLNGHYLWLRNAMQEYPVVTLQGFADAQHNFLSWNEADERPETIEQLDLIRYNRISDPENRIPALAE